MTAGTSTQGSAITTRVALGAVTNIKALPSRDISQIIVELPDEFHVALTSLVYGKNVLLMRSPSPDAPLGISDLDAGDVVPGQGGGGGEIPAIDCVHGYVSLVRAAPSRMVTVMHVDIPSEQHVQVTSLLFGAYCMALPCHLPPGTGYGLLGPRQMRPTEPVAADRSIPADGQRPPLHRGLGHSARAEGPREPLKWMSARCKEALFQQFLQVESDEEAREVVRAKCGMASCSELTHRTDAVRLFVREIYQPYQAYERRRNLDAARTKADGAGAGTGERPTDDGATASPFRSLAQRG